MNAITRKNAHMELASAQETMQLLPTFLLVHCSLESFTLT